jgi:hypothetical protein
MITMNKEIKKRSDNKYRTYRGDKKPKVVIERSDNKHRTYIGDKKPTVVVKRSDNPYRTYKTAGAKRVKAVKQAPLRDLQGNIIAEGRLSGEYSDTIFNTSAPAQGEQPMFRDVSNSE